MYRKQRTGTGGLSALHAACVVARRLTRYARIGGKMIEEDFFMLRFFARRVPQPPAGTVYCKQCAAAIRPEELTFKFAPTGRILFSACKRCTPDGTNELPILALRHRWLEDPNR